MESTKNQRHITNRPSSLAGYSSAIKASANKCKCGRLSLEHENDVDLKVCKAMGTYSCCTCWNFESSTQKSGKDKAVAVPQVIT